MEQYKVQIMQHQGPIPVDETEQKPVKSEGRKRPLEQPL